MYVKVVIDWCDAQLSLTSWVESQKPHSHSIKNSRPGLEDSTSTPNMDQDSTLGLYILSGIKFPFDCYVYSLDLCAKIVSKTNFN